MPPRKKTLYDVLGVAPEATAGDIDLAYERRVAELQGGGPQDASELALARDAHQVLRDPGRRAAYDASLATAPERAAAIEQPTDLALGPEERTARRVSWPLLAAVAALAIVVLYYALRPARLPDPEEAAAPARQATAPAPAPAPATPPPPRELAAADILKVAIAATGRLSSVEMSGRATPLGLAIAVESGTMVTTCHDIPAGSKLVVQMGNETLPADLAITDERLDLCRLAVAGLTAKPLGIASQEPVAGARIFALGVNAAGQFGLTEGTITQVRASPEGNVLELSMPIAPAGSGGPVFDAHGRLVAIATTQYRDIKGGSLALPSSWVAQMRSRGAS